MFGLTLAIPAAVPAAAPDPAGSAVAQTVALPGLPGLLHAVNDPIHVAVGSDGVLELGARGDTNLFLAPGGDFNRTDAPMLLCDVAGDFVFSARVEAPLHEVYDVAALVVYENDHSWAKLCFENSAHREPTVVSVVTRGVSDDCNSEVVGADFAYLAMVRRGDEFAFHWSRDGKQWRMVRHFRFAADGPLRLGFAVHAVDKAGLAARFSEVRFEAKAPAWVRGFSR